MSEQASATTLPREGGAVRRTATVRHREPDGRDRGPRAVRPGPLRLVADGGRLVPQAPDAAQEPVRTEIVPRRPASLRRAPASVAPPHIPVRLTRRGRIVVTVAAVLAIGAVSMALAGVAQATGHPGSSAAAGRGVVKVVIRPGQSLWSVAEAYDPDADTRAVIRDILQMNSLNSTQVQPGQALWVPRD
jgi:hypothetical protein